MCKFFQGGVIKSVGKAFQQLGIWQLNRMLRRINMPQTRFESKACANDVENVFIDIQDVLPNKPKKFAATFSTQAL